MMVIVRQTTASSALAAEDNRMDTKEVQEKCTAQLGGRFAITAGSEIILVKYASDDRNPTINKADKATKQEQRTIQQGIKQPTGQYGTIKYQ